MIAKLYSDYSGPNYVTDYDCLNYDICPNYVMACDI